MTNQTPPILQLRGLTVGFDGPEGVVTVIQGIDLQVAPGEAVALVGESGCGKSVTARSVLDLLPSPPAVRQAGQVIIDGVDLQHLSDRELQKVRGQQVGFIFQNPMSALNPVLTIGAQITERLRRHLGLSRKAAKARAIELLEQVGIADAPSRIKTWPHQLSGGMRQRVVIAIALACGPKLLIADEPTTALDVTIQAQIMRLLGELRRAQKMALLLITHDLGLVAQNVDRVVVMYAGQIVEQAPVRALFANPRHPYTRGLLAAVPGAHPGRLRPIRGTVPPAKDFPTHCRFADRCDRATEACHADPVPLSEGPHPVRCLHPHD